MNRRKFIETSGAAAGAAVVESVKNTLNEEHTYAGIEVVHEQVSLARESMSNIIVQNGKG